MTVVLIFSRDKMVERGMALASSLSLSLHEAELFCGYFSNKPKLKFRSYNPVTEELKEKKLPKARPEKGKTKCLP